MKQIRFLLAAIASFLFLATEHAPAQMPVSVQRINFALLADYEADYFGTNSVLTNEDSIIRTILVNNFNIGRGLFYEAGDPAWTNFAGMVLVREVNLTNGAEGIYLRGNGIQTNVEQYFTNQFGPSWSNDFTGEVPSVFPVVTNFPAVPIYRGYETFRTNQPPATNNLRSETMFFVSVNAANVKLNLLTYGMYVAHPVAGRINGVLYHTNIDSLYSVGVGTLFHTVGTNVFLDPAQPPTNAGPVRGTFWTSEPVFMAVTNGPG